MWKTAVKCPRSGYGFLTRQHGIFEKAENDLNFVLTKKVFKKSLYEQRRSRVYTSDFRSQLQKRKLRHSGILTYGCVYLKSQKVQEVKNISISKRENSQSSHQKSPYGGISPSLLYETFRASNSVWKIGITRFIRITQSKVRPIENLAFLMISVIFKMILLWTALFKWSLWY